MSNEVRAALIAAVVSAVATIGGTYVGARFAGTQRAEERAIELKKQNHEQRLKLLERLSLLANSKSRAVRLRQHIDEESAHHDQMTSCLKTAGGDAQKRNACTGVFSTYAGLSAQKEYVDLHASYASTLQLAKLYFGEEVGKRIDAMTTAQAVAKANWWDIPGPEYTKVIEAMRDEIRSTRF